MKTEKRCCNCFKLKPISDDPELSAFYPNRTGKPGNEFQSRCKDCNAEVLAGYKARKREQQAIANRAKSATVSSALYKQYNATRPK